MSVMESNGAISGGNIEKAPMGAETRWGGYIPMHSWVNKYKTGLMQYIAPEECVVNDDGTTYNEHTLEDPQWLEVLQIVSSISIRHVPFPCNDTVVVAGSCFEACVAFLGYNGSDKEGLHFIGAANVLLDH